MRLIKGLFILFCGFFVWFYPAYFLYVNLHLTEIAGAYFTVGWMVGLLIAAYIEKLVE